MRWIIEAGAARLAAGRRSDEEAEDILRVHEAMAEAVDDYAQYIEADQAFHDAIFRAAANPILAQKAEMIRVVLERNRRLTVQVPDLPPAPWTAGWRT